MSQLKSFFSLKNLGYILFLVIFTLLALEIILHVYNPFASRVKGNKIILPVNQVYKIDGSSNPKLDKQILHTKNSLGFRGAEKPANLDDFLSIITVGGSTTECFYLSDDKTWQFGLEQKLKSDFGNVWINNAGLDGHSTFGHQILLDDFLVQMKPKIILFLVGINDVARDDLNDLDKNNLIETSLTWRDWLARKSELFNIILTYKRAKAANRVGGNADINYVQTGTLKISDEQINKELANNAAIAARYKQRLLKLVETCRRAGIEPILMTQPSLYGEGIDELTGVDLENARLDDKTNGKLFWQVLDLYNRQTRDIGAETNSMVIDLAYLMPKNSLYFYDSVHYTNEGASKISEILDAQLTPHLREKYPSFQMPAQLK